MRTNGRFKEQEEEIMEKYYFNADDIAIMTYTLQSLHYRGISVDKTVNSSINFLKRMFESTRNREYMVLAVMHMKAYADMGFPGISQENQLLFDEILGIVNIDKECLFHQGFYSSKKIKLSKIQIQSIIGKWSATQETPLTKKQLVDDIIEKVSNNIEGHYIYTYTHGTMKKSGYVDNDCYELVIDEKECYFHDIKRNRYYTFEK